MEALNIILLTQLVIIIFLSSSVLLISSATLPDPPTPSSEREIFNKIIIGIMTRLTCIANGGVSEQESVNTLDESTVSKLKRAYPNDAFVEKLLKKVQEAGTLDRDNFVIFLSQNAGFLEKALEICFTYNKNTDTPILGFGVRELVEILLLPRQDANHFIDIAFITWKKAAERIYLFGGYTEAKPQATKGKSQKQPRTGCC